MARRTSPLGNFEIDPACGGPLEPRGMAEANRSHSTGSPSPTAPATAAHEGERLRAPGEPAKRTLFIVLDSGTAIRNIVRTEVMRRLKAVEGLRIVLFSPVTDEAFRNEVAAPNVLVEPRPTWNGNVLVRSLRSLRKDIWAEKANLFTFKSKRGKKEGRILRRLMLDWLVEGRDSERVSRTLDRLHALETRFTPLQAGALFEQYKPDLVFYTTIYSPNQCVEVGAVQRGIPTVAFVQSWDNPTSKGPFPTRADHVVVWNHILKEELLKYHRFQPGQVHVSGAPQFDLYTDFSGYRDRAAFFKKWGLDPDKRLLTYTTGTPGTSPFDHEVVDLFYERMRAGAFNEPCQLLVRLHPKDRYSDYVRFEQKPGLILQLPGKKAETNDHWNPDHEDMHTLAELMRYSDVVINVASTITIDAAAFDTPVVNVAFDGYAQKPYMESCLRYYDYDHYKRIVETGGVRIGKSIEETIEHTQAYLRDRTLEAAGRARIREEQCWKLDGQSGRRIADLLLELMERPR